MHKSTDVSIKVELTTQVGNMDVSLRTQRNLIIGVCCFSVLACSEKPNETTIRNTEPECAYTAIEGEYIVKWRSGEISTLKAGSIEEIKNQFLSQHESAVEFIEPNQRLFRDPQLFDEVILPEDPPPDDVTENPVDTNWALADIAASAAWQQNIYGDGVVVAVIDSGVDLTHSALQNAIYQNPGETGIDAEGRDKATNGIDDDQNGYVDDHSGWDFVNARSWVTDSDGHGTHVAGIIAAAHNVSGAFKGVAPAAQILPLDFIDNDSGSTADAIAAIRYAKNQGARVINASWGGGACNDALGAEINDLAAANVLFVAASGNRPQGQDIDEFKEYPASYNFDHQITVGAVSFFKNMSSFSNFGEHSVHIFAPGDQITSTVPLNSYRPLSGTSMATPFVAGAAALLLSANSNLTPAQVKSLIAESATPGNYLNSSRGRLHVGRALERARARGLVN